MKSATASSRGAAEIVELAGLRRRHDQRPVLGADGVVGRDHAGLAVALDLGAVDEIGDGVARAEIEDQPPPRALGLRVRLAAGAAHDRRDLRRRAPPAAASARSRTPGGGCAQPFLGARDQFDRALVALARIVGEAEQAVLVQDQAPRPSGARVVDVGGELGEREARHDVGHDADAAVEQVGADRFAVRLVDQAEDRGRVGVVDELVRQERVQQRLDRGIGRRRVEQVLALDADHVLVAERRARAQLAQAVEPHRRHAGGLDRRHVGAGALDAQHVDAARRADRARGS